MDNKVNSYKNYDLCELEKKYKKLVLLQECGLYPKEFDMPLLLQLELTSQCNVHCKHCYNNSGNYDANYNKMTPEKWKEFCTYIVSKGGIFECVISGGEPLLLGNDLYDIMDILHNDGTYFLLITNGYLLNESVVDSLSKYRYKWIQVSIDGSNAKYHDEFRQREGSWKRAVKGAYLISKAGLPLTIAHSVSSQNLNDIDDMCNLAYSIGAGSIIIGEISLSGRSYENPDLILDDYQREVLLEKIENNVERFKGKMIIQRSADTEIQLKQYSSFPCGGNIIRPNGDIRLDCMMPFTIGNVLEDDFQNVWITKGKNCWHNPKVMEYISSLNNSKVRNYVDKDLLI